MRSPLKHRSGSESAATAQTLFTLAALCVLAGLGSLVEAFDQTPFLHSPYPNSGFGPRYAVIDLGTNGTPTKITDSGYVLLSGSTNGIWYAGVFHPLALASGYEYLAPSDITEDGTTIGFEYKHHDDPFVTNGDGSVTQDHYKDYAKTIWATNGTITTGPVQGDYQKHVEDAIFGWSDDLGLFIPIGENFYHLDDNKGIAITPDHSVWTEQNKASTDAYIPLSVFDTYHDGTEIGTIAWYEGDVTGLWGHSVDIIKVNNHGQVLQTRTTYQGESSQWPYSINDPPPGSQTNYLDSTALDFAPYGLSNKDTNGVTYVVGQSLPGAATNYGYWYNGTDHTMTNFYATAINAAVSTTNNGASYQPAAQMVGSGFVNGSWVPSLMEMNPTNGAFGVPQKLDEVIAPGSGWSGISTQGASINDSGAIVGTATYTPTGTMDPIAAGSHGVLLLPVSFVREGPPGSGNFQPIKDNGLDDKSELPMFHPDMATTLNRDETCSGGYVFTAQLSQNLSTSSTGSMTVLFYNSTGTFSGTATETAAGSGIFKDSGNTITITLSPTTQTTSSTAADKLQVQVTDSTLGLSNAPFTLSETGVATSNFAADVVLTEIDLSGTLSTTSTNTIVAHLTGSQDNNAVDATLTETGVNTRIFTRTAGDVTIAINSLSGTGMQISLVTTLLKAQTATLALTETGSTSNAYSNFTETPTTFTALDPGSSGQGVFYIQVKGFSSTVPIIVSSGSNSVTVNATPVSGSPGLIRTPPIALLASGTSGTYSGITTLQTDPTANTICFSIFGTKIDPPKKNGGAFIGRAINSFQMPWRPDPGESPVGILADMLDGAGAGQHLNTIEKILIGSASANIKGLGWSVTKDQVVTYSDITTAVSKYSLFYIFAHGATPSGTASTKFGAFNVWPNYLDISLHPLIGKSIHPSTISANIGTANYKLVFINGCASADDTSSGGVPLAFAAAFKNASAQPDPSKAENTAYVGWSTEVNMGVAASAGPDFFTDLTSATPGNIPEVQDAVRIVNNTPRDNDGVATLVTVTGQTQTIDLTPIPPSGP